MKVTVPERTLGVLVKWSRIALLVAATASLGYCAFVFADTGLYQREADRAFDQLHVNQSLPSVPRASILDGLVGRIQIPRLGLSVVIAEGTADRTLRRAAGHIAGTAIPGSIGNVGIAGHRDTLFRPLRNVQEGDLVIVATLQGEYQYRVVSTQIVDPSDVSVLHSDIREILTLVTCYPFYALGPAPDRFIVRAERVHPAKT